MIFHTHVSNETDSIGLFSVIPKLTFDLINKLWWFVMNSVENTICN